jgi:signal transduction histidine kinase
MCRQALIRGRNMTSKPRKPPPVVTDAALGGGVAVVLLAAALTGIGPRGVANPGHPMDAVAAGLITVVAGALAVRRRCPMTVLVVLNLATFGWLVAGYPGRLITVAPLIGCYTVAAYRGWRWAVGAIGITGLNGIVVVWLAIGDAQDGAQVVGISVDAVLLAATAGCAGAAVGYHRAVVVAAQARLARETQTREERARRHAAEERLRIARELHDVIGHLMATISVQAGVGIHLIERRPAQALEALGTIKKISDDGLAEVKTILGVLRTDTEEPRGPDGRIGRLDELLDVTRAAGLETELIVRGNQRRLPATVEQAAYRIIQEALTNVLRHAHALKVWVYLTYGPARLHVRIRDNGTATEPDGAAPEREGQGIAGMRERVLALSGDLHAGPHLDGGFEVRATLPTPQDRPDAASAQR